ncbi:MAG: VOC family protein [Hyphomonadaceae bacterium]|nr:VOC family protein [Hyphomonadaceae bacterium]
MEINGVAHVFLTVGDFPRAKAFYAKLLPFLGLTPVMDTDDRYYCIGGRTGLGIQRASADHEGKRFDQGMVGLHHLCFRARERADVDAAFALLSDMGAQIVHGPRDDPWAPGYYSILFEDPDGIRLEINHIPGRGLFDVGAKLQGVS